MSTGTDARPFTVETSFYRSFLRWAARRPAHKSSKIFHHLVSVDLRFIFEWYSSAFWMYTRGQKVTWHQPSPWRPFGLTQNWTGGYQELIAFMELAHKLVRISRVCRPWASCHVFWMRFQPFGQSKCLGCRRLFGFSQSHILNDNCFRSRLTSRLAGRPSHFPVDVFQWRRSF
jgi:hypothetical protein